MRLVGRNFDHGALVNFSQLIIMPAFIAAAFVSPAAAQQGQAGQTGSAPMMQKRPMDMPNMTSAQKEFHEAMQKMNGKMIQE
jgi:hypothetical protein